MPFIPRPLPRGRSDGLENHASRQAVKPATESSTCSFLQAKQYDGLIFVVDLYAYLFIFFQLRDEAFRCGALWIVFDKCLAPTRHTHKDSTLFVPLVLSEIVCVATSVFMSLYRCMAALR